MEPVSGMPMTASPSVVGPEFCMPYNMDLSVTREPISNFVVTDINGIVIMKAKGKFFSLRDRHVLADAYGNPIISMQKKIFSAYKEWQAFRGDSCDSQDLLFSVKKSSLFQFNSLDVFLASNTSQNYCDFKIKESFFRNSSTIYRGNSDNINSDNIVAQMDEQFTCKMAILGQANFRVTVYPNVDYAFIVALIVILTEINKEEEKEERIIDSLFDSLFLACFGV